MTASHQSEVLLARMANDIADFFRPQEKADAVTGIANHIRNFWTKRMREKLTAHRDDPELALDELSRAALRKLADSGDAPAPTAPGGDAG